MATHPSRPARAGDAASAPILLAGPTAVGKSDVALRLAERLHGEIVAVDSMQVYRGLDIGTAKPTAAERDRVRHHLLDVVELTDAFDAARFAGAAHAAVAQIQSRGRVPILCGGTGLYFRAFLEGLGEAPPADAKLRAELEVLPLELLLRELAERDPVSWKKIDRRNPRRVIRAIEVLRLTGRPFSQQRAPWSQAPDPARPGVRAFGFSRQPADLRARIDARVDAMFQRGLVEETRTLLPLGLAQNPTALQAIGYRQVVEHLRGGRPLADTIARVKTRTWQFAKRQMTWFRRQAALAWLEVQPEETPDAVVARILNAVAAPAPGGG